MQVCWDSKFWIFSPDGKYLESWGTPGSGDGQLNFLVPGDAFGGVAFASDGSFYTFDGGNLRVQRFDKNRHFLRSWGGFGTEDGQFVKPTGIGVDREGRVYVADSARSDVQVFAPDGTFLRTIAKDWADICGIAYMTVTADGNVYLSSDGVHEYASDGTKLADFNLPAGVPVSSGVAVDAAGHLFVTGGPTCHNIWTSTVELAADGRVIHVWPATGEMIAVGPKAQFLYATEPDWGFVRKYDLPSP